MMGRPPLAKKGINDNHGPPGTPRGGPAGLNHRQMKRRTFIRNTALCAVAVSTSGFIRFDGHQYVGDCATTTDILGPFYRPGSPLRTNLRVAGEAGIPVELSGTIWHNDCKTPCANARIELWHCSAEGVYDNSSSEFRYRGTTLTDSRGRYAFTTVLPVPYKAGNRVRPAHFHLMITAQDYQPLVTQLYFAGDKHLAGDPYASSPKAQKRILSIKALPNGSKKVVFDTGLSPRLAAEAAVIERLAGVYREEKDHHRQWEFFKKDDLLWMKNEVYGEGFEYIGQNTFQYPGLPAHMSLTLRFELLPAGAVKVTKTKVDEWGKTRVEVALKEL